MKYKLFLILFSVVALTSCNDVCKDDTYSTILLPETITKYELGIINYLESEDTYIFKFYNLNYEYKGIENAKLIDKDNNVIAYNWHEEIVRDYLKDNLEAYGLISYEKVPNTNKITSTNFGLPAIKLIK